MRQSEFPVETDPERKVKSLIALSSTGIVSVLVCFGICAELQSDTRAIVSGIAAIIFLMVAIWIDSFVFESLGLIYFEIAKLSKKTSTVGVARYFLARSIFSASLCSAILSICYSMSACVAISNWFVICFGVGTFFALSLDRGIVKSLDQLLSIRFDRETNLLDEKLDYLYTELALTVDPHRKFILEKSIQDLKRKLRINDNS